MKPFTVSFEYDETSCLWEVMVSGATLPTEAVQGFNAVLATIQDSGAIVGMHHRALPEPDGRYKIDVGIPVPQFRRMNPSTKHPDIEKFLEGVSGRTTAITSDRCISPPLGCGQPATEFRDERSRKEFTISGLCQKCQDTIFGV